MLKEYQEILDPMELTETTEMMVSLATRARKVLMVFRVKMEKTETAVPKEKLANQECQDQTEPQGRKVHQDKKDLVVLRDKRELLETKVLMVTRVMKVFVNLTTTRPVTVIPISSSNILNP